MLMSLSVWPALSEKNNVVTRHTAMREPITYGVPRGNGSLQLTSSTLCCQLSHSKQWLWVAFYLCFSFYPLLPAPTIVLASRRSAGGAFLRGSSSGHPLLPIRWMFCLSIPMYTAHVLAVHFRTVRLFEFPICALWDAFHFFNNGGYFSWYP
jgi:hypothetical protein